MLPSNARAAPAPSLRSRRSRRIRRTLLGIGILGTAIAAALVALPQTLPPALSQLRDDIIFHAPSATQPGCIYLTIDDSPSAQTDAILAVLEKYGVHATFFVTTDHVAAPAQLERIVAAGHRLGHHMKTTRPAAKMTLAEFRADFDHAHDELGAYGPPTLYRPPSGFGTREQNAYAKSRGYTVVLATVFPLDHWIEDPAVLRRLCHWLVVDGAIIVLHDGRTRGANAARVLDRLIPELQARGWIFGDLWAAASSGSRKYTLAVKPQEKCPRASKDSGITCVLGADGAAPSN